MDITVTKSELAEVKFIHTYRSALGDDGHLYYGGSSDPRVPSTNIMRYPKEILAIRAAEYNLPVDDPRVLDMVMLEHLIPSDAIPDVHPLYVADTVAEALAAVEGLLDKVRAVHGKPKDAKFLAQAKRNVSKGLVQSMEAFHSNADHGVVEPIRYLRDKQRGYFKKYSPPEAVALSNRLQDTMMVDIYEEASAHNRKLDGGKRPDVITPT